MLLMPDRLPGDVLGGLPRPIAFMKLVQLESETDARCKIFCTDSLSSSLSWLAFGHRSTAAILTSLDSWRNLPFPLKI